MLLNYGYIGKKDAYSDDFYIQTIRLRYET